MLQAIAGIDEIKFFTISVHRGSLPSIEERAKSFKILGQTDRRNNQIARHRNFGQGRLKRISIATAKNTNLARGLDLSVSTLKRLIVTKPQTLQGSSEDTLDENDQSRIDEID